MDSVTDSASKSIILHINLIPVPLCSIASYCLLFMALIFQHRFVNLEDQKWGDAASILLHSISCWPFSQMTVHVIQGWLRSVKTKTTMTYRAELCCVFSFCSVKFVMNLDKDESYTMRLIHVLSTNAVSTWKSDMSLIFFHAEDLLICVGKNIAIYATAQVLLNLMEHGFHVECRWMNESEFSTEICMKFCRGMRSYRAYGQGMSS